jgi:HK97 family phage major capsid protein
MSAARKRDYDLEFKQRRDEDDHDDDRAPQKTAEYKKLERDLTGIVTELQNAIKTGNAETKGNIEKKFAEFDEVNAKFAKERGAWEKKQAEEADVQTKRMQALELALASRKSNDNSDGSWSKDGSWRMSTQYKNFLNFCSAGDRAENLDRKLLETKSSPMMRTDIDVAGGYLVPPAIDQEIRRQIVELSPIRAYATNRTLPAKSMEVRRRLSGHGRAMFEGEMRKGANAASKYGMERVTTYKQTESVLTSLDMLLMSPYDVEQEISADAYEAFALGEVWGFLFGTGERMPKGLMVSDKVKTHTTKKTPSADQPGIDYTDLAEIVSMLKRGQNPRFYFNRRTLGLLRQITDNQGRPLWQMAGGEQPAMIWGVPYSDEFIDLDDAQNGSGSHPILFGDMRRGYEIFDTTGTMMVRDDITFKKEGGVEFTWNRWLTGDCLQEDAMIKLQIR